MTMVEPSRRDWIAVIEVKRVRAVAKRGKIGMGQNGESARRGS